MIQYIEDQHQFILSCNDSAYVLGISEKGYVLHSYFGEKMIHFRDYPLVKEHEEPSSFTPGISLSKEEYVSWGSDRFTEPCLKVILADGCRELDLRFESYEIQEDFLNIVLVDKEYNLELHLHYHTIEHCNIIKRSAKIINNSKSQDIEIDTALSASLHLPQRDHYRLQYLSGKWIGEFQKKELIVPEAKVILESRRGSTGHGSNPWFTLDPDSQSNEDWGEVYFGLLAYSGNWKILCENSAFNQIKISGGINDFDSSWILKAGNSFETPEFIFGYTKEGFGQASRNLHDYARKEILQRSNRNHSRKVLYNSWEATYFDVNETNQLELAEKAAKLGVELFVMDDGWFGERNSDQAGLGDWYHNNTKFPDGLNHLIETVHSLGMDFGIWVEPEMVNKKSNLYSQHPDWIYGFPKRNNIELRNQLVLNLGLEEVRKYIIDFMSELLWNHDINFIKWDMNRAITNPGSLSPLKKSATKEIWHRHVMGLYEIFSLLKNRFPEVSFQACSGGGGRVDLGILKYCDQYWVSDNTDAIDRLRIQDGFSQAYTAKTMESWVTAEQNWVNNRVVPLEFRFHVAMMGVLGLGDDISKWTNAEENQAIKLIAEYKKIRPIIQNGDLYRLQSQPDGAITASIYVSKSKKAAVLFAFCTKASNSNKKYKVRIAGLDDNGSYVISSMGIKSGGKALRSEGIELHFSEAIESKLIHIEKV